MLKKLLICVLVIVCMILNFVIVHLDLRKLAPPVMPELYIYDTIIYFIFMITVIIGLVIFLGYIILGKQVPRLYRIIFIFGISIMMICGYYFNRYQSEFYFMQNNYSDKISVDSQVYKFEYNDDYQILKPLNIDIVSDEYLTLRVQACTKGSKWIFDYEGVEIVSCKKVLSTSYNVALSTEGSIIDEYELKVINKELAYFKMKSVKETVANDCVFDEAVGHFDISLNISYK